VFNIELHPFEQVALVTPKCDPAGSIPNYLVTTSLTRELHNKGGVDTSIAMPGMPSAGRPEISKGRLTPLLSVADLDAHAARKLSKFPYQMCRLSTLRKIGLNGMKPSGCTCSKRYG
jgi:hypothetical protein